MVEAIAIWSANDDSVGGWHTTSPLTRGEKRAKKPCYYLKNPVDELASMNLNIDLCQFQHTPRHMLRETAE